jgi:flagellar export protein FliJ
MSSFHFRLETLLRLRLADRDQRRAELAKAQRAEVTLLAQSDALACEQVETQELTRKLAAPGTADVDRLIASHRYELVLRTKAQQLAGQIQQVRAEVERRWQIVVEADRQVRVLEKLRERQQLAHNVGEAKHEQKQLDEQALVGFTHREVPT